MNHFKFTSFLTTNMDVVGESKTRQLLSLCRQKEVAKGSYLLREGQRAQHAFFVEKGLLRQFSIDGKGKEHIIQFAPENWMVADRESEYFDQPAPYFIEALEDTTVFFVHKDLVQQLSEADFAFMRYNNRLLHNHIRHLQRRVTQLQSATAEERYLDFVETYPDILLRVPQAMVASYLGITPETLSRIRKDLARRSGNGT